jgi:hypothetical protein
MPTIFDFLYREYCRARLTEMRKQLLLVSGRPIPEVSCDVSHLGDSNDGFGDDRTATQHEALHISCDGAAIDGRRAVPDGAGPVARSALPR